MIIASRPTSLSVSTTSVLIALANPSRLMYSIVNTGSNPVSIGLGSDVAYGSGIYLLASGGAFLIDNANLWAGQIFAISSGAGTTLAIQELSRG